VTLEGKIFGWHKLDTGIEPLIATLRVDNTKNSASYTGLTSAKTTTGFVLYAADNANNTVEMYDESYRKISNTNDFVDSDLPEGYSVYNLKNINEKIYVTYKRENGGGIVNVFDLDGKFIKRLITDGELDMPWGLTLSPKVFTGFEQKLLIGNFGDGQVNIYGPIDGEFLGKLKDEKGNVLEIEGLMALTTGTNNGAGTTNELFFSAGAEDGTTYFGKLPVVSQKSISPKTASSSLRDIEGIEKEYLLMDSTKISYEVFSENLKAKCVGDRSVCVIETLEKNKQELNALYKKLFTDAQILKMEFKAQGLDPKKTENLDDFLSDLEKLSPNTWLDAKEKECEISANSFYAKESIQEAMDVCLLYNTQNWLKQLYVLRSIFIRADLGPLGPIENIQTKAFRDLIDEEENRVQKAY